MDIKDFETLHRNIIFSTLMKRKYSPGIQTPINPASSVSKHKNNCRTIKVITVLRKVILYELAAK
jgi:hypothetical protein